MCLSVCMFTHMCVILCAINRRSSTLLSKPNPHLPNPKSIVVEKTSLSLYVLIILWWDVLMVQGPSQLHGLICDAKIPLLEGSEGTPRSQCKPL